MKKVFTFLAVLIAVSLTLNADARGRSSSSDDSEGTPLKVGFGLDGINTANGAIPAASVRWDMGKVQFDALLGFNSTSFSVGGSSSTFGLGGQFGYVFQNVDNLKIKFLGRITFASVAPS